MHSLTQGEAAYTPVETGTGSSAAAGGGWLRHADIATGSSADYQLP